MEDTELLCTWPSLRGVTLTLLFRSRAARPRASTCQIRGDALTWIAAMIRIGAVDDVVMDLIGSKGSMHTLPNLSIVTCVIHVS